MTSTNIDLPLDILIEILSYLSLNSLLLKTCTLNRLFLKLSLDFLYQEIYLPSTDPDITQTFNTIIRDQLVANRIRRIRIFSHFSVPSELRCGLFTRNVQEKFYNTLIRLEELHRLITQKAIPSDAPDEAATATSDVLLLSVRELSITSAARNKKFPELVDFLKILWERHNIGESLRKLEVAAGTVDTLLLLVPTTRYLNRTVSSERNDDRNISSCNVQASRNPRPCSITHLSIRFVPEFDTTRTSSDVINRYLSQLIQPLASTLSSFSLSYACYPCADSQSFEFFDLGNPNQQDFSEVLEALPYLPALKEVKFHVPFTPKTMKNPGALTEWLRAHQDQLEYLTIGATSLISSIYGNPGKIYSNWLTGVEESHYRGFLSLSFALLRSLEIRKGCRMYTGQGVFPSLKRVTPSLRSLTIGYDEWLVRGEVENVLNSMPTQEGCCGVETFRLRFAELTPALLDLLHEKLPRLKVLVVDCRSDMRSTSFDKLSKRKYSWQLSYLRITTSASRLEEGVHFHPHLKSMEVVANCLDGDPVLDMEFTCRCNQLHHRDHMV